MPAGTPGRTAPGGLDRLRRAVLVASARLGAPLPLWDERLAWVAREAAAGPQGLAPPAELQDHLEATGVGDPAPSAFLVTGPSEEVVAGAIAERLPPLPEPASHFGVGLARRGAEVRAVVVRSKRRAFLDEVPTSIEPGRSIVVQGRLAAGLVGPTLYVEEPDGRVVTLPIEESPRGFRADLALRAPGSYRVELMPMGARGPEVAWLYTVRAGVAPRPAAGAASAQLASGDMRVAGLQILDAINRDRLKLGEPALAFDPNLAAVARAYSRELGELHLLAHVSPRSGDLPARLKRAGYAYARAGENLAEGTDPLQAHALAASSPAHRRNMLDPTFDRCGIGVADVRGPGDRVSVIITELFAGG
ncbi:MAG: CAP domain-containing protein [Myxococcales bacterium]